MKKNIFSNKGSTLIIFALTFSVMMGFGAIAIDVGRVTIEKNKMQNAIDAAILAAAQDLPEANQAIETANSYITANGYETSDIQISFNDSNSVIKIDGIKEVEYSLAKFIGFDSTKVKPNAIASGTMRGGPFDYALFSGNTDSPLTINGGKTYILGSAHTNESLLINGNGSTITGVCEAVNTVTVDENHNDIANIIEGALYIDMPDFSEEVRQQAEELGSIYVGDRTFNNSLDATGSIYVDGDITINGSGTNNVANISGQGCILATEDIIFNGSSQYVNTDSAVCLYSENGDIIVNGAKSEFYGVLYAPNGHIIYNGTKQVVYGRIIAKNVTINGGMSIFSSESDIRSLPKKAIRLVR